AQALDRLLAALPRARPDLDVELAPQRLEVHPADDLAHGLGAHAGAEEPALAGLVEALIQAPQLGLADGQHRLDRLELVAQLLELFLEALGVLLGLALLGRDGLVHRCAEVGDLLLDSRLLVALALLDLLVDALGLGAHDGAQLGRRRLAALLARSQDDLAGGLEDDRVLGRGGLQLGEACLDLLCRGDDLLGAIRALGLELRLGVLQGGGQLGAILLDVGLELRLEVADPLPGFTTAAGGLFLDVRGEALARLLVDRGDDVQGEVQDPLEVAGADVEQDAQTAGRALEVPDVADRAGQLDMAHPLPADLGPRHLDTALVADDALVADALVLAAVALPVPRGTEDALVEEAVLLRLERAVVDGLGLRHLALRPLPDLVRAGERDTDRREVVDLEHRSPLRRRGAWRRVFRVLRGGPGR